jgi:hypothetical protein
MLADFDFIIAGILGLACLAGLAGLDAVAKQTAHGPQIWKAVALVVGSSVGLALLGPHL